MRERSETIYAENQEEFLQKMEKVDQRNDRRRKIKEKNFTLEEDEERLSFKNELCASFREYKMTVREPTFEEKERNDESDLLQSIVKMNRKFRDEPKSLLHSLGYFSSTVGSAGLSTLANSGISDQEAFLSQNLINFCDILKLIVIGDRMVGKTFFVNRFVSESFPDKYRPTERYSLLT